MIDRSCTHESARMDARFCPTCGRHLYRSAGIDYTDLVASRTEAFTGRGWVFAKIDAWLADERGSRVFFLAGGPGTGKSTIAARLVQISEGEVSADGYRFLGPGRLTFYQLCQASYNDTLDPLRFTTSLFLRLKDLYPTLIPAFLQTLPPDPTAHVEQHVGNVQDHATVVGIMHNIARLEKLEVGTMPAKVAFDRLVAAPLKKLGNAGRDGPLVILVDALDEALTQPGETLVGLLGQVVDDPRDLPPNVRLLVTGRPDDRVLHEVGEPALDLVANAPPDADDVRAYAHRRLDDPAEPWRGELADRIAAAAEGNFLYARYVIDDLPPLDQPTDLARLSLPKDLFDLYRRFLKRELARSRVSWNSEYAPLLGVLAVAQDRGLTFSQLAGITSLAGNVLTNLLLAAGQYLAGPRPDGPFRLYHQSFRDFLLEDDTYRVFPADAHRQVAGFFWQAFRGGRRLPAAADGDSYTYAIRYLPLHLAGADDRPGLRDLLLDYCWLSARLAGGDTTAAIADYGLAPDDPELRLVGGAIRLSAHVLAVDGTQLAGQLSARLLARREPGIQALLAQAAATAPQPWLRLLTPSLAAPGGPRLRTLAGHTDGVLSVAVLPDGRRAVSASSDKTLIVWDLETGERMRTLEGHTDSVDSVAILPDGRRAVSGSEDQTLIIWDLETGERLRTLTGHTDQVDSVTITPDGRRAVSGSWDQTLIVWDLESGEQLRTLAGHTNRVYGVAILPDGRRAVSASVDTTLIMWDLESGKQLRTLEGHSHMVMAVAVLPDGRRAVSGSEDQTLILWDLETGERLRTLEGHTWPVSSVAVLPDGRRAVSGSWDQTLIVWDLETGERLHTLEGHAASVWDIAILPDGRRAVSASTDETLILWDLEAGERLRTLKGHTRGVNSVTIAPDGRRAVSGSWDENVIVWDLDTREPLHTLEGHALAVESVAVLPGGQRAVSASRDKTLIVWDLETGEPLRTLEGHSEMVTAMAVRPDGRRAVSGDWDGALIIWDLETGKQLRTLTGRGTILSVAILLDGRRAVSASYDQTLIVWNLDTGERLHTLEGHSDGVNSVAILPDGRRAVSASDDNTLIVWDLEAGERLRTLEGHTEPVISVAILPDGRRAISASDDRSLRLWDLEAGEWLAAFRGDAAFRACDVAPDGRTVLAGDEGGRIHFLQLEELA